MHHLGLRGRIGDLAEGRILPARTTAHRQSLPGTEQAVAGVQAELVLRFQRGHLGARLARDLVREPTLHLPALGQLARHFQLVALGPHAHQCSIGILPIRCLATGGLGEVVLVKLEQRCTGVEAAIEELGLQAHFVAAAFQRIQRLALLVTLALRLEDGAVAGVHRIVLAEVVDHAGLARRLPTITFSGSARSKRPTTYRPFSRVTSLLS
ncbi:hypothetical protein G6F58_012778 [Rhizopus delemar]|nr:hypothetical protein G6F58_012778 [Rhizopus delemar]